MTPFRRMVLATLPISLVVVLSWFGVFTFVNGYCLTRLGYSNAEWSRLMLWLIGAMLGWQIVCTEIARRLGRVRTLTLAMAGAALGHGLLAMSANPWMLRAGLVLIAGIIGMQTVIWFALVAETGRRLPGRAMAVSNVISTLIVVLVLIGGGFLVEWLPYRRAFLFFAGLCAASCWIFFGLARLLETGAEPPLVSLFRFQREDLRGFFNWPFLGILLLGVFIEPFNFHTANQLFPNLMRDAHLWTEQAISMAVALGRVPGIILTFLVAQIIDRVSAPRAYGIGMLTAGLGVLLAGLAKSSWPALGGYLLFYAGQGIIWASNMAAINGAVPARLRDAAFAILGLVMGGGIFLAGWGHALLLTRGLSIGAVFAVCGLLGALGAAALIACSFGGLGRRASLAAD